MATKSGSMRRSSSLPRGEDVKDEHGHLQSLSSPILSKINDGFVCFKAAITGKANDKYTAFYSFEGAEESALYIGWDQNAERLVLVFKAMGMTGWEQMRGDKLVAPAWLAGLANDAKVEAFASKELSQFVTPKLGIRGAREVILDMTGGTPPRRISTVGFCIGGSVATLAATWTAVQWPTADVRCISFGAPAVGNASFVAAFRWLVSLSYRVMFRRDPVAEESTKTSPHRLKHVHGAVYISNESMQPGTQPKTQLGKGDMGDHNPDAYSGALDTTCSKTLRREKSAGGACRAQMHLKCMLKCPKKRREAAAAEATATAATADLAVAAEPDSSTHSSRRAAKHDTFAEVDDDGQLAQTSSNGLGAYVRAGVGNLASDSACIAKAAVTSAVQALTRMSSRKSSGLADDVPDTDVVSAEEEAQPPRLSRELTKGQESSGKEACRQFHAVMKNAGLEAPDEEIVPIQQLLGCPNLPVPPIPSEQLPQSASQPPLESAPQSSSQSASQADSQEDAITPHAQQKDQHAEQRTAAPSVDLDKARSISANESGDLGQQKHDNDSCLDQAEASTVMDALEDPATLEAEAVTLSERANADAPGLGGSSVGGSSSRKLSKTFSMLERDSLGIDPSDLSNLQKVLVMGKISQAAIVAASAYRDEATFKRQTGITNSRLIHDREHHDTKVHVGWLEGGTAVFAFRGTATRQDGLQDVKIFSRNIDYLQELYPGVKAHLGFLQQFAAVCHPERPELNMAAVLRELSGGQTPNRVICCGHSLGGALATLGAAWAALEYPDADVRCISFGSPRVANKVFSKAFNALVGTSLRLVHGFDPVPALPPSMMYKHVPGVIHIRRQELLLQKRPWHTMFRTAVSDHSMLKYNEGIYRHMPGGLESLPHFFIARPVNKMCDTFCPKKAAERRRKTILDGKSEVTDGTKAGKHIDGKMQPEHFWAGPFGACFGNDDAAVGAMMSDIKNTALQQSTTPTKAATVA